MFDLFSNKILYLGAVGTRYLLVYHEIYSGIEILLLKGRIEIFDFKRKNPDPKNGPYVSAERHPTDQAYSEHILEELVQ